MYHLCFELPSTGNCGYPWQPHIPKCDKLKYISGTGKGGLLLPQILVFGVYTTKVSES